jgi:hypothetical protein
VPGEEGQGRYSRSCGEIQVMQYKHNLYLKNKDIFTPLLSMN